MFCRYCWNDLACSLFPATTTKLNSQSLSSLFLCCCLEIFSTTNNFFNSRSVEFQQVISHRFCSWNDVFTQKWNCGSSKRNLYLSRSNHLVSSFRLKMNVGRFSKHRKKTSDTNKYKGCPFTARVSQVNVNTMKRTFSSALNCRLLRVC